VLWEQRGRARDADWREHRSEEVRALLRPASRFSSPGVPAPSREQWTAPPSLPPKRTGAVHLVIGDPHAHHGEDRWRFAALGRMIRSIQPDRVVCIGDWWDNESFTRHTRGTLYNEGQRALLDWQAGNDALSTMLDAAAGVCFTGHITLGNHDLWPDREQVNNPHLAGLFDRWHAAFEETGWEVAPFLQEVEIDGITYVHFLQNGMGRALGAKFGGAQLLRERHATYTVGHSHRLDHRREPAGGKWINGLHAGCFIEDFAHHAGQNNVHTWWRGICVLVADGDYDLECYSLERIKRLWG